MPQPQVLQHNKRTVSCGLGDRGAHPGRGTSSRVCWHVVRPSHSPTCDAGQPSPTASACPVYVCTYPLYAETPHGWDIRAGAEGGNLSLCDCHGRHQERCYSCYTACHLVPTKSYRICKYCLSSRRQSILCCDLTGAQ
jgi:hypothetical protein